MTLQGYVPARPPPIRQAADESTHEHVRLDEFDTVVTQALPIADALAWLAEAYPDVPLGTTLRLYGRMHSGRYGATAFDEEEQQYRADGATLAAHPMHVGSQTSE